MKLLKPELCLCRSGRGNVKLQATLVEGQGIGFWTRVRLPSGPLEKYRRFGTFFIEIIGKNGRYHVFLSAVEPQKGGSIYEIL